LVLSTVLSSFVTSTSLGCFVLVGVLWIYLICWYLLTKLLFLITIASLSIPMFLSREWVISEFLLRSNSCSSVRFYCLWVR
jgi:ABC-type protease/lipase transport system fused ATPase/permease subunit